MSETISIILSFAHPLATVLLTTLWTLRILRNDYRGAIEQMESSPEQIQSDLSQPTGE
jgi:hypothetical protein